MRFTKLHGCGNDYLYIDCVNQPAPTDAAELARKMSDRHFGVGSDGLILVLPSEVADARMRMFNADGSEAVMCGNGVRAMAKFLFDNGLARRNPLRIQTIRGVLCIDLHLDVSGKVQSATVDMEEPILDAAGIPVQLPEPTADGRVIDFPLFRYIPMGAPAAWMEDSRLEAKMTCVSMGSAHVVIFCENAAAVPLATVGPILERHAIFPQRINVHFAQARSRGEITMRTWEKGSGMTLACGTGACAVVVAGVLTNRLDRNVLVHLPGGDLQIEWRQSNNHVYKTGPAVEVFSGEWPD